MAAGSEMIKAFHNDFDPILEDLKITRDYKNRVSNLAFTALMLFMLIPVAADQTWKSLLNSLSVIVWINLVRMFNNIINNKNCHIGLLQAMYEINQKVVLNKLRSTDGSTNAKRNRKK